MRVLSMVLVLCATALSQQPASERAALKLELKFEGGQYVTGRPISARVSLTSTSDRLVRLALRSERTFRFDGTLAGAVRLVVKDAQGRYRGIGEYGNYNRGPSRIEFEVPARGNLEGTANSFLGYALAKGSDREDLPVGAYTLFAVLGDHLAGWSPRETPPQGITSNSVPLQVVAAPKKLSVADLDWLAGKWKGEQESSVFEESWSAPAGGSMLGTFRWITSGKSRFFEFLLLEEDAEGVVLRFKHFSPGYRPWENEGPIQMRASQSTYGRLVFTNTREGASPKRISYALGVGDTMSVTVESKGADGKPERSVLRFKRSR